ncbi:MAG: CDP-diacylglycerol--serine O-phosphatidyltransferase [Rickettsiales bacterium]|nr:CDP-diacylglycerol--serine O-phosphatidyltransferase [Rickettsiales bacterium]
MMKHILKPGNLFTSASLFCGLYSVMVSAGAEAHESDSFYTAALLIIFAGIFDGLDGRVARLTNTQSDFGVELDSLVDVVSFGVAPAVLLFKWGLEAYGRGGLIVAFLFTLCGVFRLARFNMDAHQQGQEPKSSKYTEGLTITCAGGMVAVLVLHHAKIRATEVDSHISVLLLTLMLSYLMISTVGFRTFREFRLSPLSISMIAVGAAAVVAVLVVYDITLLLVLMGGTYIGSGLVEEAFSFTRKRKANDFYYLGTMDEADEEEIDEEVRA